MSARPAHVQQAIDEYRTANPDDADIPDERIERLFMVQQRILGLAMLGLGRSLGAAWSKQMRRILR